MLQEVFYWLFNMSITAAITGMLIMLIRTVKKIPRRFMVFLWIIPFLRMSLPIGLNSPYSLMTLLSGLTTKTIIVYQPADNIAFSLMNSIGAADTYFPISYKVNILDSIFHIASIIWIIVTVMILLMLVVAYFTAMREIKGATHLRENIYFSENVISPAVYGFVKPKIILLASYKNQEIAFVLLHEKTHIRSRDNLWRIIAVTIAAVHWFNPFCWLFLNRFLADLEMACDERVLTRIGYDHAKEYASSLLESKRGATVFASAFGGAKIRTRIENILSFKKLTWLSLTVFIALMGMVFYTLLTNAG